MNFSERPWIKAWCEDERNNSLPEQPKEPEQPRTVQERAHALMKAGNVCVYAIPKKGFLALRYDDNGEILACDKPGIWEPITEEQRRVFENADSMYDWYNWAELCAFSWAMSH